MGSGAVALLLAAAIYMALVVIRPAYQVLGLEAVATSEAAPATDWEVEFERDLKLVAYRLDPEVVAPGENAALRLYWQSRAQEEADFLVDVQAQDRFGNVWFSDVSWMTLGAPEKLRDVATAYLARRSLSVPPSVPVGRSLLAISVRRATGSDPLRTRGSAGEMVGRAAVRSLPIARAAMVDRPEGTHASPERFGPGILLLGHTLPAERLRAGEALEVTLYWRATQALDQDFSVFVHLLDERGNLVAQRDSQPNAGQYPTSTWMPGTVVRDQYTVPLPRDLSPGSYSVLVGMYEWPSLQRLRVETGGVASGDSVRVGKVVVGP